MTNSSPDPAAQNPSMPAGALLTPSLVIDCPNCETRFRLSSSEARNEGRRLRCSTCRHVWLERFGVTGNETTDSRSATSSSQVASPATSQVASPVASQADIDAALDAMRNQEMSEGLDASVDDDLSMVEGDTPADASSNVNQLSGTQSQTQASAIEAPSPEFAQNQSSTSNFGANFRDGNADAASTVAEPTQTGDLTKNTPTKNTPVDHRETAGTSSQTSTKRWSIIWVLALAFFAVFCWLLFLGGLRFLESLLLT